jgi:PIN domain nuclease of toxin-antitoxin system
MNLLLDTHVLLWMIASKDRIGKKTQIQLESTVTLWVSSASLFEISIKYSLGKLALPSKPVDYLPSRLDRMQIRELPVTSHHSYKVAELPWHHRDPFDRLLLAQSAVEKYPLVTADDQLFAYKAKLIDARR